MTIEILPADHFTVQELTDLYNQTRVDYLVPMPMNSDRLNEYIHDFDIDLSAYVERFIKRGFSPRAKGPKG